MSAADSSRTALTPLGNVSQKDTPLTATRRAHNAEQIDASAAGATMPEWRDGLVFHYHVGCAPGELVGAWRSVD